MEAKIAALEEEISILKGEIKSILQEVRTAVLASENPFAGGGSFRAPAPSSPPLEAEPLAPPHVSVVAGSAPADPHDPPEPAWPGSQRFSLSDLEEEERDPPPRPSPPAFDAGARDLAPEPSNISRFQSVRAAKPRPRMALPRANLETEEEPDETGGEAPARRLGVSTIATLISWMEETAERLDSQRLGVVLGLARYAGLIDAELEELLMKVSAIEKNQPGGTKASINDCLLSLRQLDAVLGDEDMDETSRARRRRVARAQRARTYREVPASRRR